MNTQTNKDKVLYLLQKCCNGRNNALTKKALAHSNKAEKNRKMVFVMLKSYKGLKKDLTCRNMQYKDNEWEEVKEKPIRCTEKGLHSCLFPMDVFSYYPPTEENRYYEAEIDGDISKDEEDSKVASSRLRITKEIGIEGIIKASIDFLLEKIKNDPNTKKAYNDRGHAASQGYGGHAASQGDEGHAASQGDCGHAASQGYCGHAASQGYGGHAASQGYSGHAASQGDMGHAASQGYKGHAASQGDCGHAASQGDMGHTASQGYGGHAASQGYGGHAASQGDWGHAASQGYCGHAASQGYGGHAASQGYKGHAASQGDMGHAASQGYGGHAASQGYKGHAAVFGKEAIAASFGIEGRAKGALGCWLMLAEWYLDDNYNWHIKDVRTVKIDGDTIKADTWYALENGVFVEKNT
jgi:hypothetical protein